MGPSEKIAVVVVLSGNLCCRGRSLGTESRNHCAVASRLYGKLYDKGFKVRLVVSSGTRNLKKYPDQHESVAKMMKYYIIHELLIDQKSIWTPTLLRTDIEGELQAGFECREYLMANETAHSLYSRLHIVSSWYQVPKVKSLCKALGENLPSIHMTPGKILATAKF